MNIYTYSDLFDQNACSLVKGGLDKPSFIIDFADGIGSGVTLTSTSYAAYNSAGTETSATVISGVTTSGTQTTVSLLTCGTAGTGEAVDGARFEIRILQTLSNSRVLEYKGYVYVNNPAYDPD